MMRSARRQGAVEELKAVLTPEQLVLVDKGGGAEHVAVDGFLREFVGKRFYFRRVGLGEQIVGWQALGADQGFDGVAVADVALLDPYGAHEVVGEARGHGALVLSGGDDHPPGESGVDGKSLRLQV